MKKKGRSDFVIEVVKSDKENHVVTVKIQPDPRRHAVIEIDGVQYFKDRYLNVIVSAEEMLQNMQGLPIYHLAPSIESTQAYASRRRESVQKEFLDGAHVPPPEKAIQHQEYNGEDIKDIAFLSVDICGGSAYRKRDPQGFEKAYEIFIRELGTLVGQFKGRILKTTGDGFIAYVDHPAFTSQCDVTIDLGLSLITLVQDAVNPVLTSAQLAPIAVRVGADYGLATTRKIVIPSTNYQTLEMASDALNRAVKIEESCESNQFRIGRELYELVHVKWLERAEQVPFDGGSVGIDNYRVYQVR